jgi:hypothetical protein
MKTRFPDEILSSLDYYVYRLIDPRTGETFYIGKGKGNRLFSHVNEIDLEVPSTEEEESLKLKTIRTIKNLGLEPIHIIHRHGLRSEREAFIVEAALIDVFPGLSNLQRGHGSDRFGPAHSDELVQRYAAAEFPMDYPLLVIRLTKSIEMYRDLKDAVRAAWPISPTRASKAKYVIALVGGICRGIYMIADSRWIPATRANFPFLGEDIPKRFGFVALEAPEGIRDAYLGKKLPRQHQPKKGSRNPILYVNC